jgi:hypothetical protein
MVNKFLKIIKKYCFVLCFFILGATSGFFTGMFFFKHRERIAFPGLKPEKVFVRNSPGGLLNDSTSIKMTVYSLTENEFIDWMNAYCFNSPDQIKNAKDELTIWLFLNSNLPNLKNNQIPCPATIINSLDDN